MSVLLSQIRQLAVMNQRDKTQRPLVTQDHTSLQNSIQKIIQVTTREMINSEILLFCNFHTTQSKYLQQVLIYTQKQDQPSFTDVKRPCRKQTNPSSHEPKHNNFL